MTQPLPLSDIEFLTEFAAWCREQDGTYDYWEADNCAVMQFLRDTGKPHGRIDGWEIETRIRGIQPALNHPSGDWTFAALADRVEQLIPAQLERVGA